jgi:hypothetical protein
MTDFRALCAELAQELAEEYGVQREFNAGDPLLGSGAIELLSRARTALAQPEPQGPTDEELHRLWLDLYAFHDGPTSGEVAEIARAVLARWGRPVIEPVPVTERLPGPEDCDAEGRCWWWIVDQPGELPHWIYCTLEVLSWTNFTAWLPHYALPVPQ